MSSRSASVVCFLLLSACGGSSPPVVATPPAPAATDANAEPPAPRSGEASTSLTAEECEKQGGHVVNDIGDGATHRPNYRCPGSGQSPFGRIKAEPGKPFAIEGAVCCP